MTTVYDILEDFRVRARNTREMGDLFEQLMIGYFSTDPLYTEQFEYVRLWMDWEGREGRTDTGIDLVAKEKDGDGYCAIQCKFYERSHVFSKEDLGTFLTESGKVPFTSRLFVSTTTHWGKNAEDAIKGQRIPVRRIGLQDLNESAIDWGQFKLAAPQKLVLKAKKGLRPHQRAAIDDVFKGFEKHARGKLIMACGTGKTFTALKLAEELAARKGSSEQTNVLFLVPSISLIQQTLREWTTECSIDLQSLAVCSDIKVGRGRTVEDISVTDLAYPATTDSQKLLQQVRSFEGHGGLTTIFSTYQSIATVAQAQKEGLPEFDIIICDEAHRTTGVKVAGDDESSFVRVHDEKFIQSTLRLYMTATPRLYDADAKQKANEKEAVIWSMDDEKSFGPEFHRLGFGKAVGEDLLSDYKVLILAVDEKYINSTLQSQVANKNSEISLEDTTKIVGCWNGLAKRSGETADGGSGFGPGEVPMRRAVAFSSTIAESKSLTMMFNEVLGAYAEATEDALQCEVQHVDGTQNALIRGAALDWLRTEAGENECRILSNARCLSEGVDVPNLDAVLFLNPRNSQVDVVQAVGRVMRKAEGKDYGYIILPIAVPSDMPADEALSDNKRYRVVWQILQALRAHDDRFNATINKIELNKSKPKNIMVGTVGFGDDELFDRDRREEATQMVFNVEVEEWRDAIYAKIVQKVGERTYWETWATDIAKIAARHVKRVTQLVRDPNSDDSKAFDQFLQELRANINPGVTRVDAIDMLAQHLITKPVFDALFEGYEFSSKNPVSITMQRMLDILGDEAAGEDLTTLESFYDSVRMRASDIDNHGGRQKVITELYERFFKTALPKTAEALGIVYTPIPIVDFIVRAADQALRRYFSTSLSAPGVQIIDPFTGTGTFIVRLLQSGLITQEDLLRKYTNELHANEIVLLAYYIAAINIEATFHDLCELEDYIPFDGIVLTDTFQLDEDTGAFDAVMFPENSARVQRQRAQDIRVVVGNPPYSAGQASQNDNNQNQSYPALDQRIAATYAASSSAALKSALYDSYIRAIRWASDRIVHEGVICFVSNGGYIDANSTDGLRKALADEFNAIYCFNLRGNQRTAGELSKKEGGKIFGSGSRSTIAILLLVKTKRRDSECKIFYRDIGDYLTRDEKLAIVDTSDLGSIDWIEITANPDGDWINQRNSVFQTFMALDHKTVESSDQSAVFENHSAGLLTSRDAWVYGSSAEMVEGNVRRMIDFYNGQVDAFAAHCREHPTSELRTEAVDFVSRDMGMISWGGSLISQLAAGKKYSYEPDSLTVAAYRPFSKQYVYFNNDLNQRVYQLPKMFPTLRHSNIGFYVTGLGNDKPFSVLAIDHLPDLAFWGSSNGQFFPLSTFASGDNAHTFFTENDERGLIRSSNISRSLLEGLSEIYGHTIGSEDLFHYVYAILHSPLYREQYAADLKKMLPRIPKVTDFQAFSDAGKRLVELHVGYEEVETYALDEIVESSLTISDNDLYRVQKMAFGRGKDRSRVIYNSHITLGGIPAKAYEYTLGARSAIEWIMERYQVTTHKDSGIINDPNDWSDDPRYIIDLLKRIVTVSLETVEIIDSLPPLDVIS